MAAGRGGASAGLAGPDGLAGWGGPGLHKARRRRALAERPSFHRRRRRRAGSLRSSHRGRNFAIAEIAIHWSLENLS